MLIFSIKNIAPRKNKQQRKRVTALYGKGLVRCHHHMGKDWVMTAPYC
jgi:hypothetical protein